MMEYVLVVALAFNLLGKPIAIPTFRMGNFTQASCAAFIDELKRHPIIDGGHVVSIRDLRCEPRR